jgi:hypothetical protein
MRKCCFCQQLHYITRVKVFAEFPTSHLVREQTAGQFERGIALLISFRYNGSRAKPSAMLRHRMARVQRSHCEGKGATAMSDIPNDDKPGFVAEKPEHCFARYRLIRLDQRPGQMP